MAKETLFNNYYVMGQTDVGRRRTHNEDNILINVPEGLLLIADGMGGHDAGEEASLAAITVINQLFPQYLPCETLTDNNQITSWQRLQTYFNFNKTDQASSNNDYQQVVSDILMEANKHIFQLNEQRNAPAGTGMGTTLVGCCVLPKTQQLLVFHVGDSRLYRFNAAHQLEQITKDHSMLQLWHDNGCIGVAPKSNVVLQAIGPYATIQPSVQIVNINANQDAYFLLCSDGLSDMLDQSDLTEILSELDHQPLEDVVQNLIDSANAKGGQDNISVIILQTPKA